MSRLRSHDLREAISNLLTVAIHLQDTLSRFHRPGLHRPSCPRGECVDSHPCVSRSPELLNCPCTAQSFQASNCTSCSTGLSFRYPRKLHQPAPSARIHQNSNRPCSVSWKTHTRATEPCGMPAIPGTSRLQPTIMLHAGCPIKYLSKRLMLISSRVVAVPT